MSYQLANEDMTELLNKLNGLYVHGDSLKALHNTQFQETLAFILDYVKSKNLEEGVNFPLFLMGHSV